MPLDGTPYATQNANQQGQQKRRAAANVPAPPAPVQPAPYQTPTYGDVLKDARAGVQEPGSQYGLDRMTGQPFSVGRMQQQGIGEANRFVDRSIYRRAMTDPRSLYPENRTGIAPINLMAENARQLELEGIRDSWKNWREQQDAEAKALGFSSGFARNEADRKAAANYNYQKNMSLYGTPRNPGQMKAWAERAEARQRMLDRKRDFEKAKYGRIALDRYGILPDMETANLYAMTNQPVETMTAMGALNAAEAASEQAKAQMEYQKGLFEQQARQADMESLKTIITTPGIDQGTRRRAEKRLFELSSGLTGQGATQAGPPGQAGQPAEAAKAVSPLQAANMNPQERQDVIDTARYDEGLKQYFPDMKDPQSIAWTMGEKLRYGVVPPEDVLQKLSNYVSAMGAVDTTFRAGSQRRLPTLFGSSGGDWRVYDDIINAPPGKKREAAIRTLRDVYGSGSVALLPQEDQQILAGIQAPPAAPPQASPAAPAPAAPPRPASPQAPTAPQATAPPAAPQRPMTPDEQLEERMAEQQQQQGGVENFPSGVRSAPKTPLQQAREATQASLPQRPAEPQRQPQPNVAVPFFAGPSMMPPQGPAPPSVVQQVREAIGLSGPPANVPVRAPDRYATNSPELSPMNITSPQVNAPEAGLPPAPQRTVSPDLGVPPGPVRTVGSVAAPSEGAPPNPAIPVASPQAGIAPVPQSATPQAFANLSPENMLMLQQAVERQLAAQRQLEAMRLREMLKSMTPEQAARQMEYMPRGMAMPGQVPMAPEQFNAPITPTPSPTMLQNLLRAEQPWISTEPMTRTIPRAMGRAYGNLQQGMRSLDERINRFLMP